MGCPVCGCDPCDCHGVHNEKQTHGQFWRVRTAQPNGAQQNHYMVGRSNTRQPNHGYKMAGRGRASNTQFFKNVYQNCRAAGRACITCNLRGSGTNGCAI